MTADIGGPVGPAKAFGEMARQHIGHHPRVTRRQRRPILHHQVVMIGNVADPALMAALAQIGHQITRADDGFGLVNNSGGGDAGGLNDRL